MNFDEPPLRMANYNGVLELRSRLPHVPETVIAHFLSKYGNVDECYEKLKDNYTDEYDLPAERSFTLPSRPTPTSANGITTNESPRPSLQRSPTYGPGITDTGGYHGYASAVPPPSLPAMRQAGEFNYPGGYAPVSLVTSSPHDFRMSEADTTELLAAQNKQVDHIHKIRDSVVHDLSLLRSNIDKMKQELTKLRIEVSEGPIQSDIGTIQDVISTLQYDVQSVHNKIQVEKTQVEMKGKLDVYTEEGVRWNCQHCKFLNHPLMTRCEFCDRPKR